MTSDLTALSRTGWLIAMAIGWLLLCSTAAPAKDANALIDDVPRLFPEISAGLRSGPVTGSPPAAEIFQGSELIGYAFSTRAVTQSVGYSGKPLDIHVGLRTDGRISGTRLVAQEEPILVIGIKPQDLEAFVAGLAGLDIRLLAREQKPAKGAPDHVAGATVSSTVIKDAVLRSARAVAISRALFGSQSGRTTIDRTSFAAKSWADLIADRAVVKRTIRRGEVAHVLGTKDPEPDALFIELIAALVSPAMVGQNLFGIRAYERLMARLPLEGHAVMIAANGLYSYKGVEWRQTGLFERIQLVQGSRTLRLRREMYENIERLAVEGSPELREIGLFLLPPEFHFDPLEDWRLELIATSEVGGERRSAVFPLEYALPPSLLRPHPGAGAPAPHAPAASPSTTDPIAGRVARPPATTPVPGAAAPSAAPTPPDDMLEPLWIGIWQSKRLYIAVLLVMLLALSFILFTHDVLTRKLRTYRITRLGYLTFTFVFLGLVAGTQLSVVNVITFTHALLSGFRWEFFLVEPLTFILWCFVALALLFWGRGVFCGWLCPFGALQELLNEGARKLGIRQIEVPWTLHERLWPIKYVAFLLILGVSFQSTSDAFRLAEIEPFKTTISLRFMRDWPFVVYALALLGAGLFIERFYCRYVCPLGAALAIPAKLRIFEWLKRRPQCGRECRICATRCTVQAINPIGVIVSNECIYCLQCQANYYDPNTCLTLKQRAMRRNAATTQGGSDA